MLLDASREGVLLEHHIHCENLSVASKGQNRTITLRMFAFPQSHLLTKFFHYFSITIIIAHINFSSNVNFTRF